MKDDAGVKQNCVFKLLAAEIKQQFSHYILIRCDLTSDFLCSIALSPSRVNVHDLKQSVLLVS